MWRDTVNGKGGLLGRKVELVIKDDASNQNTVVSDYNALISRDKVDLLLGTFSSLLNLPASAVAERNRMLYVEPAGGNPDIFNRGFKTVFFAQQATADHQGDVWARYILSLPGTSGRRPPPTRRSTTRSPRPRRRGSRSCSRRAAASSRSVSSPSAEQQIVLAADVMVASPDFGHLEPMLTAAQRELDAVGVTETPEVVLADAGYWHQPQMQRAVDRGIQVLVRPDSSRRTGARPGWDGGLYTFMRRVLATERGAELYGKRQPMIEPIFGDMKFNRRIDRFQRRGRAAARTAQTQTSTEWRLITATHNLLKLWRHTMASTPA